MSLVNTIDMLKHAEEHKYAVGAFNVVNLDFLNGILEAAESLRSPVILNIAEVHFPYVNIEQIAPAIKYMAESASVPVVLNLDHGLTFEAVVWALRCGFSSIMYDASTKSLEQNIEETKLVVKMAHAVGVSVEGELGHVGGAEGGSLVAKAKREYFTKPDDAVRYVEATGIDTLAVSVGNVHGFYDGDPELDFDLIEEIRDRISVPLVLHGGSGISDDDFRRAIQIGMRKVNIYTEMSKIATDRLTECLSGSEKYFIPDLLDEVKQAVKEVVKQRIKVFGSADACLLPGNICPSGGAHTGSTKCAPNPLACGLMENPGNDEISTDALIEIVTKVVTYIASRP